MRCDTGLSCVWSLNGGSHRNELFRESRCPERWSKPRKIFIITIKRITRGYFGYVVERLLLLYGNLNFAQPRQAIAPEGIDFENLNSSDCCY